MCLFLEFEFACSDGSGPHRVRTNAICMCKFPLSCICQEEDGLMPLPSEAGLPNLPASKFKTVPIGGDCSKCAKAKSLELAKNAEVLEAIGLCIAQMDKDLDELELGSPPPVSKSQQTRRVPRPDETMAKVQTQQAVCRPEIVCSWRSCVRAPIIVDGRQGQFCEKHTCAARDWGCLLGVSTKMNGPQYSAYCTEHTCIEPGCGLRIADQGAVLCKRHLREWGF